MSINIALYIWHLCLLFNKQIFINSFRSCENVLEQKFCSFASFLAMMLLMSMQIEMLEWREGWKSESANTECNYFSFAPIWGAKALKCLSRASFVLSQALRVMVFHGNAIKIINCEGVVYTQVLLFRRIRLCRVALRLALRFFLLTSQFFRLNERFGMIYSDADYKPMI